MLRVIALLMLLVPLSTTYAGEYNPVLSIGDVAPPWEDLSGTDGKSHSWKDLEGKQAIVVIFTCNGCPYAVDYEPRIKQLAADWKAKDKVGIIAVNSNLIEEDSLKAMQQRAKSAGFKFPYLKDEKQELGKAWGATRTPEFFVLDGDRKVVYMGAMDDDTDASKAKVNYVSQAIEAVLKGKSPEVTETVPIGCNIRYKRTRRR